MGSQQDTLFLSGAVVVLMVMLAALGLALLLVRRWRREVQQELKTSRNRLRGLQNGRRQIQTALGKYSPADPAPYGPQAAELTRRQALLEQALAEAEKRQVLLQERTHRIAADPWRSLVGAPFLWRTLSQDARRFSQELEKLQTNLSQAQEAAGRLDALALDAARQAKQASRLELQARQLLDRLRGYHLQGKAFEDALQQHAAVRGRLAEIPPVFVEASEKSLQEKADKTSASLAFAILGEALPRLETLLQQGKSWEQQRSASLQHVQSLLELLQQVETNLAQAGEMLEVKGQQERVVQISEIARTLQQTVERLEIESASLVDQEAERLADMLREMDVQVRQAQEQQPRLQTNLGSLATSLKELSYLVGALGTKPTHPIRWTQSSAALAALNRQANSLGGAGKRRTPEQALQDLGLSAQLLDQAGALLQQAQKLDQQHSDLQRALESPEFNTLAGWLQNARRTAQQAAAYAAENWPRQDLAASLVDDLKIIEEESQLLSEARRAAPIPEDELAQELEATLALQDAVRRLHRRVENIQNRLGQIQLEEKAAQSQLEKLGAALQQIAFVVRSNSSLAASCEAEAVRLQEQVAEQGEALAQRSKDTVEHKTKNVQALAQKIEQAANRWLAQLNQALGQEIEALSAGLGALKQIAPLSEGVVEEAQRRLSASQVYAGELKTKPALRLEELPAELKRRSDFYQGCLAAAQALDDTAQPLVEAHQAALEARKDAQQALAETGEWLRQNKGWPPSSLTLQAESAELNALEERWRALQETPARALALVGQLAGLGGQYQALTARVRQGVEKAAQERAQVEELESDLEELAQRWQAQLQAYQDDPEVSREIRALLDDIDKGLADIRRQVQRKGENYAQTLQALKTLQRKVRFYQVALDEEHALDASGNVQRKR